MGYERWDDLKSLEVGSGCCIQDYAFLYGITQLISPKIIVEIGTNFGVSAIAMALAMKESDAPTGHIYTFDIVSYKKIVNEQFEKIGVQDIITYFPFEASDDVNGATVTFDSSWIEFTFSGTKPSLTEVSTTVDTNSLSGQKILSVAATTNFAVGGSVTINSGGAREENKARR